MNKDFIIGQLALFAYREGTRIAPGSRGAARGIAFIIGNRVRDGGWHDGDWLKVIENAPVHSAYEVADMDFRAMPDVWHPDWRALYATCQSIYEGSFIDDVTIAPKAAKLPPSLFYANLNHKLREWFVEKIIRQPEAHPRTTECQPLVFFA